MKLGLFGDTQEEIVDTSHNLSQVANRLSGSVFFQSNIASVVRAGFDSPMSAANFKQSRWAKFST